ncbi:MAG: LPS export ABC transporter ATP-binding protein [Synergistetes bacterium]|nr:LPS export ABC transporter ATP-binding protein [Synergistota bacterium]MCX8127165.1 LPS export ABC transporter ATP-binding protein [Synergistota bacterium]MDW8191949.1 LPS export ABC transporter ATP-binding protein [Synergistota bacterium]
MAVLRGESLVKVFSGREVIKEVSLSVREGEIVGLLGPNGAGKTTTFYMIVGLIKPDSGKIFLDDIDITNVPMYKRARAGIAYLPQEPSVFRDLTVKENLLLAMDGMGVPPSRRKKLLEKILEDFGLVEIADYKGFSLSGGERRRVEIARAMVGAPLFLLLDEPFSGIDPITVYDIQRMILSLKEQGIGILLTDHNVRETLSITDRAYLIHGGKILIEGPPGVVARSKAARKLYLGEKFVL